MTGPYDITWVQWAWVAGGAVVVSALAFAFLAWRDRRRK